MNDATVSFFIHRIIGKKLKFYFEEKLYELTYPSNDILYEADIVYYNILNEEKYGNWIREDNMTEIMTELEIWNSSVEPQLKAFNKKIEDLKLNLYESYKNSTKKQLDQKRKQIRLTEKQCNSIHAKKQEFYSNTLEGYAETIKQQYIISKTLRLNNQLIFDKKQNPEYSSNKFNQIILEINQHHINNNTYRDIAKSDLWRSYWNIGKQNVFDGPVCEWSEEQRNLANTSQMYDSVFAHPECPEDDIVEDHDLLDGWMIKQKRTNIRNKKESHLNKTNKKLAKAGEVFMMANNEEDMREIQSMNDTHSMSVFKQNMREINDKGSVDVVELNTTKTVLVPEQKANQTIKVRKNF